MPVILYSVDEAADWLREHRQIKYHPQYVSKLCRTSRLPAILAAGRYLISEENLWKYQPERRGPKKRKA